MKDSEIILVPVEKFSKKKFDFSKKYFKIFLEDTYKDMRSYEKFFRQEAKKRTS